MRNTLLLAAALGLIVATGPSALAQEQEKPSSQPATPTSSESTTQPPTNQPPTTSESTPAALPTTYTQPAAPAYPGTATPCGHVMPSAYVPGTVMYGSQFPQYQPYATNGAYPQMMPSSQPGIQYAQPTTQYAQPTMQYAQPTTQYAQPTTQYAQPIAMPVAGSVAGGVTAQTSPTGTLQLSGTTYSGMTYQPYQTGAAYPNGMAYQPYQAGMAYSDGMTFPPGAVIQTGAVGTFPDQPMILGGYPDGNYSPIMTTTTQGGRRGLFGRRR